MLVVDKTAALDEKRLLVAFVPDIRNQRDKRPEVSYVGFAVIAQTATR